MFVTQEFCPNGLYALKIYKNGVQLEVVIDDYICSRNSMPCFARAKENKLWVALAEKAWAKIHSSYHQTQNEYGSVAATMRDLTGAPLEGYCLN